MAIFGKTDFMSPSDYIIGHVAFKVKYEETGILTPVHIAVTSMEEADLVARENYKKLSSVIDKQSIKLVTPSKKRVLKDYTMAELENGSIKQNPVDQSAAKQQMPKREVPAEQKVHRRKI